MGRGIGPREKLLISICSGDGLVVRRFGASGCALVAGGYEVMCSSSRGKMRVSGENSHVGFHVAWCNVCIRCHGYSKHTGACDANAVGMRAAKEDARVRDIGIQIYALSLMLGSVH